MPSTTQQEEKGGVCSQLQVISDAYGGVEPSSPAIPEAESGERHTKGLLGQSGGGRELLEVERKAGQKRTASYDEKNEPDGLQAMNPQDKDGEEMPPSKRSKIDLQEDSASHIISVPPVGSQSSVVGTEAPPTPKGENVETCVQKIRNESIQLLLKWKESFLEGESFEEFCPARLDGLIRDARAIEENLKQQKDALKNRLQQIARTLEMLS